MARILAFLRSSFKMTISVNSLSTAFGIISLMSIFFRSWYSEFGMVLVRSSINLMVSFRKRTKGQLLNSQLQKGKNAWDILVDDRYEWWAEFHTCSVYNEKASIMPESETKKYGFCHQCQICRQFCKSRAGLAAHTRPLGRPLALT